MLTDRLVAPRRDGRYLPTPTLTYYLGLAAYLGATDLSPRMELAVGSERAAAADGLLRKAGLAAGQRLVVLNPGAQKLEKRWPADRFAAVADALRGGRADSPPEADHPRREVVVAVSGSPAERDVLEAVVSAARPGVVNLAEAGLDLRVLPAVLKRAALLVTNDTGTRHVAAAVGTPSVTLYGPTTPDWTITGAPGERLIVAGGLDASPPGRVVCSDAGAGEVPDASPAAQRRLPGGRPGRMADIAVERVVAEAWAALEGAVGGG
jgi:heptosyltransferase-2